MNFEIEPSYGMGLMFTQESEVQHTWDICFSVQPTTHDID